LKYVWGSKYVCVCVCVFVFVDVDGILLVRLMSIQRQEDRSVRSDTQMSLLMELTMVLILLSGFWNPSKNNSPSCLMLTSTK
jgi:hypothetical protein